MPVIRVSNEAYQKLLRLQADDGNSMSIFMDRLIARYGDLEDETKRTESGNKGRSQKRTRKSGGKSRGADKGSGEQKWVAGIEGLVEG